MTDPIEQARTPLDLIRERLSKGFAAGYEWEPGIGAVRLAEYEQAILRHHPDVVRLVLAARRAYLRLPHLDECQHHRGYPCDCTKRTLYDALAHFTVVPFKEVQE